MSYRVHTRPSCARRRFPVACLIGLVLLAPGWASAVSSADDAIDYTEFSLEDLMDMSVVYGASKYLQQAKEAPSSISVVTREEIRTFGYRSLAEVLSGLRGFNLTYDRQYHYVGVRGLGHPGDMSCRILVLVDGVRINESTLGGLMVGSGFPVDLDLVERIEVIRGPASSLYGTNALLGIVNVVIREGYRYDGVEARLDVSGFGGRGGRFTAGFETERGLDVVISGTAGVVEGQDHYIKEYDTPDANDGVFEDGDDERWHSLFGKALYKGLSFQVLHGWRSKRNPMASFGTIFNNNLAREDVAQTTVSAGWRAGVGRGVDLSTRASYQRFSVDGQWPYDFDYDGNPTDHVDLYVERIRGRRLTAELDLTRRFDAGHVVAVGAEYQNNLRMTMAAHDEDPYFEWYDFQMSPENWSAYMLSEWHPRPGLLVHLGARHDRYRSFGGSTNPRVAIVAEPRKGTVLKALYGTAFRAPNGYEVSAQDLEDTRSYLTLIPEEITTYELILEQNLGRNAVASVSAYHYDYVDIHDDRDVDPDVPPEWRINDAIESRGFEAELEGRFAGGCRGRCSYSFNEAVDRIDNPVWGESKAPAHMVKANVVVPVQRDGTSIGIEFHYNSRRRTIMREWAPGHALTNLSVRNTSLAPGLEIRAGVRNLFNAVHGHPGTFAEYQEIIWQDRRSFRLSLTYSR